jgi:hypothetical protein
MHGEEVDVDGVLAEVDGPHSSTGSCESFTIRRGVRLGHGATFGKGNASGSVVDGEMQREGNVPLLLFCVVSQLLSANRCDEV